nr:MAG TPA: hypothetical protein [Caudoviricetes sp.]
MYLHQQKSLSINFLIHVLYEKDVGFFSSMRMKQIFAIFLFHHVSSLVLTYYYST